MCMRNCFIVYLRHVTVLIVLTSGNGWLQVCHSHRLAFSVKHLDNSELEVWDS